MTHTVERVEQFMSENRETLEKALTSIQEKKIEKAAQILSSDLDAIKKEIVFALKEYESGHDKSITLKATNTALKIVNTALTLGQSKIFSDDIKAKKTKAADAFLTIAIGLRAEDICIQLTELRTIRDRLKKGSNLFKKLDSFITSLEKAINVFLKEATGETTSQSLHIDESLSHISEKITQAFITQSLLNIENKKDVIVDFVVHKFFDLTLETYASSKEAEYIKNIIAMKNGQADFDAVKKLGGRTKSIEEDIRKHKLIGIQLHGKLTEAQQENIKKINFSNDYMLDVIKIYAPEQKTMDAVCIIQVSQMLKQQIPSLTLKEDVEKLSEKENIQNASKEMGQEKLLKALREQIEILKNSEAELIAMGASAASELDGLENAMRSTRSMTRTTQFSDQKSDDKLDSDEKKQTSTSHPRESSTSTAHSTAATSSSTSKSDKKETVDDLLAQIKILKGAHAHRILMLADGLDKLRELKEKQLERNAKKDVSHPTDRNRLFSMEVESTDNTQRRKTTSSTTFKR